MVLLSAALNFIQTYHSQRAVERIRQEVAPTAAVLRDGNWSAIPRRELVPGDIIKLTAGDLVPADGWLFAVRDLHVQQAALTGESFTSLGKILGFTSLPVGFFLFLAGATSTYLLLVEIVKRKLMR